MDNHHSRKRCPCGIKLELGGEIEEPLDACIVVAHEVCARLVTRETHPCVEALSP